MAFASEDDLEQWALGELQGLGFTYVHGSALSPEADNPVRESFRDVLLLDRLEAAIRRLNPHLPDDAVHSERVPATSATEANSAARGSRVTPRVRSAAVLESGDIDVDPDFPGIQNGVERRAGAQTGTSLRHTLLPCLARRGSAWAECAT